MRYTIAPATFEYAESIASRCRQADVEEFLASSGETPLGVMQQGMDHCSALVCLAGDTPIAMFGAVQVGDIGVPWMVGTVDLDDHAFWVLRHCKSALDAMLSEHPVLMNFVDVRNANAIRWLKWMGFLFGEPEPYGVAGLPFCRFERRANV